jgi:hypothetical protein
MKRLLQSMRGLVGLLLLLPLLGGFVALFGARLNDHARPPSLTPTMWPAHTVRIGPPREVPLLGGIVASEGLDSYVQDLDGHTLVAVARVEGGYTIVAINLETGEVRRPTPYIATRPLGNELHVSGNYVAWTVITSDGPDFQDYQVTLHVVALDTQQEVVQKRGVIAGMVLKNNLLLWQGARVESDHELGGIYGYDLGAGRAFTVTEDTEPLLESRVCSNKWVVYLKVVSREIRAGRADLHAHNLATGEDITIANLDFPNVAGVGKQHDCDGQWVTWLSVNSQPGKLYDQNLYNLASRTSTVLDMPTPSWWAKVRLRDNLLANGVAGYDVNSMRAFDLPSIAHPDFLLINGEQAVWALQPHLYAASIIRDP